MLNEAPKKENKFSDLNGADTDFQAIHQTAEKFMKQKKYKKAVIAFLNAILLNKANIPAYIGLSKAYKCLGIYDKAIKYLKLAKNNNYNSKYNFNINYELGINYLLNAEPYLAVSYFQDAIKLKPQNLNAQIQLAITHELLEEPNFALMIYEKILEERPDFILCHNHKAGLLMQIGEFEEAARVFKQILKINPGYYRANLGLGICLDKMGRRHFAVRYYKKYIEKKPYSDTSKALAGRILEIYSKKSPSSKKLRVVS